MTVRKVQRTTLVEQAEELLARDIIEGALLPGSRLLMSDLTERYATSATPLREALQRLEGRGLVHIDPHLGAAVSPISQDHLYDTYWIRGLLESEAVRISVQRGDDEWASDVERAFVAFQAAINQASGDDRASAASWSRAHREFHAAVMAACPSPWLARLLDMISAHTERYRLLSAQVGHRDPIDEHRSIYDAAIARDAEGAVRASMEHLARTVEVIEDYWLPSSQTQEPYEQVTL